MITRNLSKLSPIVLILGVLFSTTLFAQNLPESEYRKAVKESLNKYYLDDNEKSFNAYNSDNNLILDLEFIIDLTMDEINEINNPEILVEKSKEMAYLVITEISQSDFMKTINEYAKYENIILNFTHKTKDYKYIRLKFSVDVNSLNVLSLNMNKDGFYKILKEQ